MEPIETAPRDGTVIDLWFAGRWNCRMADYRWISFYSGCWHKDGGGTFNDNSGTLGIITHWRPLPAPPEDTK